MSTAVADTKVFWSDREKNQLAKLAAIIQAERPDLAGLALLRAAIKKLPLGRQRRVVSLTQVAWFEPALDLAVKARKAEAAEDHPHVPLLKEVVKTYKTLNEEVAAFNARYLDLKEKNVEAVQQLVVTNRKCLVTQKRMIAENTTYLGAIDAGISDMRKDQMTFCLLLRGILDEVAVLRRVALNSSGVTPSVPLFESSEPADGRLESVQRLASATCKGDCLEANGRRDRKARKTAG
jgi:hypothetical protein